MKAKLTFLTFLVVSFCSYGQSFRAMFLNPNVYRTKIDLQAIRLCDNDLNIIYNDTFTIKVSVFEHLDYKIINEDQNGFIVIRILPSVKIVNETSPTDPTKNINVVRYSNKVLSNTDPNNAYNYYFAIKKDGLNPLGKTLLSTKIIGVPLIQPFKLRPSKGDEGWNLSSAFTISYNFGIRLKLGSNPFSKNYLSIVPYGFGLGAEKYFNVGIDGKPSEKVDAFALTYYQGGLVLTNQNINLGIFTGFDAMLDKQNDWFYQGKQWFSLGIGYKFNKD